MALVVPYYSMWLINHKFGVMTLFLSYNPAPQQILLALPSDYIQTLTTSHHLHGNHPVQATIICCPIYLRGPPSGIFASMLTHYSVDATHCIGEIISKHCHILSFFVSNLPNDFPSYSDQSKSFPWLWSGFPSTSLASSSATVSLAHFTPVIQASFMLLPNTLLSQSLCNHCNLPDICHFPTYPHGSPSRYFQVPVQKSPH